MSNTILLKRSTVANSVPAAGSVAPGELAINIQDGNLFYKNASNVVTVIASNQFVSVTGNVTGAFINGDGRGLSNVRSLQNGTSDVSISTANANVVIDVAGVANSVIMGPGSLFVQGPISTPKTFSTFAIVADNTNSVMFSPMTIEATGNIVVPDSATLVIFNAGFTSYVDGGPA